MNDKEKWKKILDYGKEHFNVTLIEKHEDKIIDALIFWEKEIIINNDAPDELKVKVFADVMNYILTNPTANFNKIHE